MTVQRKILLSVIVPTVVVVALMSIIFANLLSIRQVIVKEASIANMLVDIGKLNATTQKLTEQILRLSIQRGTGLSSQAVNAINSSYLELDKLKESLEPMLEGNPDKADIMLIFDGFNSIHPIILDQLIPAIKYKADQDIIINVGDLLDYALVDARANLVKTIDKVQESMGEILETTGKKLEILSLVIIVCTVVATVIFIAILFMLRVAVIKKLKSFISTVKGFTSGEGDLRIKMPIDSKDEFGEMAGYFNAFVDRVGNIIRETKVATDDTIHTNMAVAATMEELSATFQNQNTQVATVASAMEEMSASSQEVKDMIDTSTTFIDSMFDDTTDGVEQLKSVMGNVNDIKAKTTVLSETIKGLEESSSQIGDILSVINDIADQTNLLALNAAIEAARAGEAGRGFAVVADEVRKLAERTQRSTYEIETIIKSLQTDASSASKEMAEAGNSVDQGVNSITVTEQAFKKVVDSVTKVEDNFKIMSNAVVEQIAAIGGVNNSTQSIATGIEQSSEVVNQVAQSTQELEQKSNNIVQILNYFKV